MPNYRLISIFSNAARRIFIGHIALGLLIAIGGCFGMTPGRQLFKALVIGVFTGQGVLLGLWCGLAPQSIARRWATGLFGAALVWMFAVTSFQGWSHVRGPMAAMLLWIGVPFAAMGWFASLLRWRGLRCAVPDDATNVADAVQYSLGQILSLTAACGVLLTLVRGLRSLGQALTVPVFVLAGGLFAISFGAQTFACLWAALGRGNWGRRMWLPLVIACAWPVLLGYAAKAPAREFAGLALIQVLLILLTLLGLRHAGYRLVRFYHGPSASSES